MRECCVTLLQPITLALNRSDYMIGSEGDASDVARPNVAESNIVLRQIEFNTMAASFAGLSQNLTSYHRQV